MTIKRHCYFPNSRPRVWWWKILDGNGNIIADGFSSRKEAENWQRAQRPFNARLESADQITRDYPDRIWFTPEDNSSKSYVRGDLFDAIEDDREKIVAWLRSGGWTVGGWVNDDLMQTVAAAIERGDHLQCPWTAADGELRELYNELVYAVAKKYPGETRHETALRYIQERESGNGHSGNGETPGKTPS